MNLPLYKLLPTYIFHICFVLVCVCVTYRIVVKYEYIEKETSGHTQATHTQILRDKIKKRKTRAIWRKGKFSHQ